jgi:hypothetical protein
MMVAVSTSETSVSFYQIHGTTYQKRVISILDAMKPEISPNLHFNDCVERGKNVNC